MFNLKIHAKKGQKWGHIFSDVFRFYIPCAFFFCILNLKIHVKKTRMYKFQKIYAKKVENNISKKTCKKKEELQITKMKKLYDLSFLLNIFFF